MFEYKILRCPWFAPNRRFYCRVLGLGHTNSTMHHFSPAFSRLIRKTATAAVLCIVSIMAAHSLTCAQGEDDSQTAVGYFNAGQELHEKGDLAGAIKLYERALKIVPQFPEAEYQRGIAELALGNNVEAERSFRRAVELRPDWSLALAKLGSALVTKLGEAAESEVVTISAEASSLLQRSLDIDPNNAPALAALADLRLNTPSSAKLIAESLETIRGITEGKANAPASLWIVRAALEARLERNNLAKASLANALAIEPKNKSALLQLADIAIAEGDMIRATEIVSRLESVDRSDQTSMLRARIFAADGRFDEASNALALISRPNSAAVELQNRIKTQRSTDAVELEKQLAANPKDPAVLGRLCTIDRRSDPIKALEYCRRAAEAEPGNFHHALGFGAALVQAKQFDAAEKILRKLLAVAPENSSAHANLATALFQLKRFPEAKIEFQWLVDRQPGSAGAYLFLGILHDQLAEYIDALANYQQYLRLADRVENKLDIDKVNLRLPALQKLIKDGKGKHG